MAGIADCTAAAATDRWWELVPAALGAVLGAAASAIPAFVLAKRSAKDALTRDRDSRRATDKAAAFSMMVKLLRIVNGAATLRRQVEGTIAAAIEKGLGDAEPWQQLFPFSGLSHEAARFDPKELAVVFAADEAGLANELMLLAERHATNELSLMNYSERRLSLGDLIAAEIGADMEGSVGHTELTKEQYDRLAPRTAELNAAVEQLRPALNQDADSAVALIRRFSAAMQAHSMIQSS